MAIYTNERRSAIQREITHIHVQLAEADALVDWARSQCWPDAGVVPYLKARAKLRRELEKKVEYYGLK